MAEFVYQPLKWELDDHRLVAQSVAVDGGYYAIDALPHGRRNGPDGWETLPFTQWTITMPFGRYEDGRLKIVEQNFDYTTASFWTAIQTVENTERTAQLARHEERVHGREPFSVFVHGGQEYVAGGDDAGY